MFSILKLNCTEILFMFSIIDMQNKDLNHDRRQLFLSHELREKLNHKSYF